jgi:hypothetical protein
MRIAIRALTLATAVLVATGAAGQSQSAPPAGDSPEPAIRALVRAIYANDVAGYNAITMPDPRRARLTTGGRPNITKLRELETDPGSLQLHKRRPFLFRGREAAPDATGRYPIGTTALYVAAHGGSPTIVILVRQADGWKVDPRWWLAMIDLQTSAPPEAGTPEFAARALTAALIAMDRKAAEKYATPGASLDVLFLGAQREPSGHLDALAMEMPVVELRPGEFYPLGDGVVEGSSKSDVKVLLGLFGVIEVPFVVRRAGGDWRVEPQPYFQFFMR